jgi:hypothetical protein
VTAARDEDVLTPWLTIGQVVSVFGIERTAVYRRLHTPEWAPFVTRVGSYRVNRVGLEDWLSRGGDLCPTISENTNTGRSSGTRASRGQMAREQTGRAHEKSGSPTPAPSPSSGTRLRLRVIESSRSPKRTST